jgi:hypothetical protein
MRQCVVVQIMADRGEGSIMTDNWGKLQILDFVGSLHMYKVVAELRSAEAVANGSTLI